MSERQTTGRPHSTPVYLIRVLSYRIEESLTLESSIMSDQVSRLEFQITLQDLTMHSAA
jgi:hypothetical protein